MHKTTVKEILSKSVTLAWLCGNCGDTHVDVEELVGYLQWLTANNMLPDFGFGLEEPDDSDS